MSSPAVTGSGALGGSAAEQEQWAAAFAALDPDRVPAGFTPESWQQLIEDGTAFLAEWGSQASELGWTTLDLFGVHPIAPAARYDCMGLVPIIRGDAVVNLDERCATMKSGGGGCLTYLRRRLVGAVLVWDLV